MSRPRATTGGADDRRLPMPRRPTAPWPRLPARETPSDALNRKGRYSSQCISWWPTVRTRSPNRSSTRRRQRHGRLSDQLRSGPRRQADRQRRASHHGLSSDERRSLGSQSAGRGRRRMVLRTTLCRRPPGHRARSPNEFYFYTRRSAPRVSTRLPANRAASRTVRSWPTPKTSLR